MVSEKKELKMNAIVANFKKWVDSVQYIQCYVMDNGKVISKSIGRLKIGDELNNSGYPEKMTFFIEMDYKELGYINIGDFYINDIRKIYDKWHVTIDAHHSYVFY
jgi:hypothetical protein